MTRRTCSHASHPRALRLGPTKEFRWTCLVRLPPGLRVPAVGLELFPRACTEYIVAPAARSPFIGPPAARRPIRARSLVETSNGRARFAGGVLIQSRLSRRRLQAMTGGYLLGWRQGGAAASGYPHHQRTLVRRRFALAKGLRFTAFALIYEG